MSTQNLEKRLLIKFGNKEHLEMMQKEGLLYCNTIKFFSELEENMERGDPFESVVELEYLANSIMKLKPKTKPYEKWKTLEVKDFLLKKHFVNPLGNLFCMSAILVHPKDEPSLHSFDERLKSFGSHFLIIYQQNIFLEMLWAALKNLQFKFHTGLVNYINLHKKSGIKDVFEKDIAYSYQQEFRIYIMNEKIEPFKLYLGNIESISKIYSHLEVPQFLIKNHSSSQF